MMAAVRVGGVRRDMWGQEYRKASSDCAVALDLHCAHTMIFGHGRGPVALCVAAADPTCALAFALAAHYVTPRDLARAAALLGAAVDNLKAIIRKEKHLDEDGDDEVIYKIEVAANRLCSKKVWYLWKGLTDLWSFVLPRGLESPLGPFVPAPPEIATHMLREKGPPPPFESNGAHGNPGVLGTMMGGPAPVITMSPSFCSNPCRLRSKQNLLYCYTSCNVFHVLFGFPTRYGAMATQMKAFFDSTGFLWEEQRLVGKPAGFFVSSGTQGGGQETTA
ncbi:hypothetical protein ABZP36_031587 [Zizania latifolia]